MSKQRLMQNRKRILINYFEKIHSGDKEQLEVIFSENNRVVIEAPAGYGKTKTMISRIAYLLASNQVPNPKKILALTFSVNAAYKIKKDVAENLPVILSTVPISPLKIRNKIFTTNYHGFCRRILKLYGYLIHPKLKEIQTLKSFDDSKIKALTNMDIGISYDEAESIALYNDAVKSIDRDHLRKYSAKYLNKVKKYFLPNNFIPFNAILVLTLKLFTQFKRILEFYKSLYPIVVVDEFQDTNILSWILLQMIIDENTKVMLMGDSLQRIYGFIGAIPNLLSKAEKKFKMQRIELRTNHRFKGNTPMLLLDKNIRENAKNLRNPSIKEPAQILLFKSIDQEEESKNILSLINKVTQKSNNKLKISVLVKQRGPNTSKILEIFNENNIDFFYALFSDEDDPYIEFHKKSLFEFLNTIASSQGKINRAIMNRFFHKIKKEFGNKDLADYESLIILLKAFLDNVFSEFRFLTIDEKIEFIKDTLENNSLKQYLGYIESNVIVSTIHGAKGLEWDIVIIPDMEQYSFPNWLGLCGLCNFKNSCELDWQNINLDFEKKFYDELSVFYVASTRARKKVIFSYSQNRIDYRGLEKKCNLSCLLKLKGINPIIKSINDL